MQLDIILALQHPCSNFIFFYKRRRLILKYNTRTVLVCVWKDFAQTPASMSCHAHLAGLVKVAGASIRVLTTQPVLVMDRSVTMVSVKRAVSLSTPGTSVRIKMSAPSACEKTCSLSSECTQHQTCSSGTCKSTISSGCSGTLTAKYLLSSVTPCLKCVRSRFSWDLNVLGSNCGAAFSHFTVLKMNNVDLSSLNAYPTYAISFILSTVHIFLILSRTDSLMIGWIYRMLV
ncbi:hypothetical protein EB796_009410 [Bugula neritina]|uniref:Uncharacterized protein n=1 Tax=Bugula neritina TaxID=10212 RepID=A0A7J7K2X9_BUGNE|nr:hypothetical protein EB796_009410 [Bugula neritina]